MDKFPIETLDKKMVRQFPAIIFLHEARGGHVAEAF